MGFLEPRSISSCEQRSFERHNEPQEYELLCQSQPVCEFKVAAEHTSTQAVSLARPRIRRFGGQSDHSRNISAYPVICLAAQYSMSVYSRPTGNERETHVDADWRMGTKAMVIKSIPIDDRNIVVFAIRGSQTFMDWAVNLNSAPSSPGNFLVLSHSSLRFLEARC